MLSRLVFIFLAVILNSIHFFIPARIINYSYDPILGSLAFLVFLLIVWLTSGLKKDLVFLSILFISLVSQISSFFVNGGVPDYINFYFFNSNIPDLFISLTLLTWWYYRVYKQPKITPADLERDA